MNFLIFTLLIANPSFRGNITLGAGGSNVLTSSTYHEQGGLHFNLDGFLFSPRFLFYRAQLGVRQLRTTIHTEWENRRVSQSVIPYLFAIKIQSNHTFLELGTQRQWITREIWDREPVRGSFEGTRRRFWIMFHHPGLFDAGFTRELYENNDPDYRRNIFEETFSASLTLIHKRQTRFLQRVLYRTFNDAITSMRWRVLSYGLIHQFRTQHVFFANTGTLNGWNNGWYGSWNSSFQMFYGGNGVLALHWSESASRPRREDRWNIGTGLRFTLSHWIRSGLRWNQSLTFWDIRQNKSLQKTLVKLV